MRSALCSLRRSDGLSVSVEENRYCGTDLIPVPSQLLHIGPGKAFIAILEYMTDII